MVLFHDAVSLLHRLFKNAGLKLTLNCSEHQSEEGIKGVQDFDRRKSKHPWKVFYLGILDNFLQSIAFIYRSTC